MSGLHGNCVQCFLGIQSVSAYFSLGFYVSILSWRSIGYVIFYLISKKSICSRYLVPCNCLQYKINVYLCRSWLPPCLDWGLFRIFCGFGFRLVIYYLYWEVSFVYIFYIWFLCNDYDVIFIYPKYFTKVHS